MIHTRLETNETRQIVKILKARPLGAASVRYLPIFTNNVWRSLYLIRINTFILSLICGIEVSLASIQDLVDHFDRSLYQSRIELPEEELPVLLRLFAKRETLAMLYHNSKTHQTLFPTLRPSSDDHQRLILDTFWNLYAEASVKINSGTSEYSLVKEDFKFYAQSEGSEQIYLLFSMESLSRDPSQIAAESFSLACKYNTYAM